MLDRGKSIGLREVPYLRNVNVQWDKISTDDLLTMELRDDERERFGVEPGDLLVCEGGEVGRAAIWRGRSEYLAYQKALHRIRSTGELNLLFLRYLLEHYQDNGTLAKHSTGSTIAHLPQQRLRALPVPLPRPEEQRRILDILEDHLSRLDAGVRTLTRNRMRLKNLRESFFRTEIQRFPGTDLTLGQLAAGIRNGIFVSRAKATPNGVPILRIGSIRPLSLDLGDLRYSERTESELLDEDALLQPGDLLFTRYNGNPRFVGACAVVPQGSSPLTFPDKLIRLRVDSTQALPEYVALTCSVGAGRDDIESRIKTTSGQAGISGQDLKAIRLSVPSLDRQREIVHSTIAHTEGTARLDNTMTLNINRAATLRRSLLAVAFSGRLTGQAIDLDRAEEMAGV